MDDWYQKYLAESEEKQKQEDEEAWQEYLDSLSKTYGRHNKKYLPKSPAENYNIAYHKSHEFDYQLAADYYNPHAWVVGDRAELDKASIASIDKKTKRKISRGRKTIEASIDLHGENLDTAFYNLARFIEDSYIRGAKTVKVITGKGSITGKAKIKEMIPKWLETEGVRDKISRYSLAAQHHGGEGAFYITLKSFKN